MEKYFTEKHLTGKPLMIHSGEAIVEYLEEHHGIMEQCEKSDLKIFASDNVEGLRSIAKGWLGDL